MHLRALPTRSLIRHRQRSGCLGVSHQGSAQLRVDGPDDESGLRVPEDVAVVGYVDMSCASAQQIQPTSVHQPRDAIGRTVVQLLLERLADPGIPPREYILPHHLLIRSSCGVPLWMRSGEEPAAQEILA